MQQIWDAINDATIYSCPSLLSSFVILSFADLKSYKFHYWFAFPAIHSDPPWVPIESTLSQAGPSRQGTETSLTTGTYLSSQESASLVDAVQTWCYGVDARQQGFFLARRRKSSASGTKATQGDASPADCTWAIAALSEYENHFFTGAKFEDSYVCFADPSNYENAPGWMLRNLLVVVQHRWKLKKVQILRYRDVQSKRDQGRSIVLQLESRSEPGTDDAKPTQSTGPLPKVTGWERNPAGKLSGRMVNLTEYMDPKRYGPKMDATNCNSDC